MRARLSPGQAPISLAGELACRLARDAEAVCRHYLSNGRRSRRYWLVGDVMNTPGRSLFVRLTGPDSGPGAAGNWTDAATAEHGDLLDLIRLSRNLRGLGEAMDEARRFLALPCPPIPSPTDLGHMPPAASGSSEAARRLFRAAAPFPAHRPRPICALVASPDGSTGPPCAITRRSTIAKPKMLRSKVWPALLAAVTDLDGNITGIQRTWLDPRRSTKAPLADPRRALGHLLGNGVRFGKAAADVLAAGEGIETMLALKSVLPSLPVIAGLSANHLAALDLPPAPVGLRRLYVARDNDAAGLKAAQPAARTRPRRRHRNPRARAGPWRLQPRSLPSRRRQHAGASRGSARPLRPDALSARCSPLRSAALSPASFRFIGSRRKKERLLVCCADVP